MVDEVLQPGVVSPGERTDVDLLGARRGQQSLERTDHRAFGTAHVRDADRVEASRLHALRNMGLGSVRLEPHEEHRQGHGPPDDRN